MDVGAGTGILCGAFYEMCRDGTENTQNPTTKVVGIEHMEGLC